MVCILSYRSELWTRTKKHKSKTENKPFEINFLRGAEICTKIDNIKNEYIKHELKIVKMNDRLKQCKRQGKNI